MASSFSREGRLPSLSAEEIEALENLDKSIKFHDSLSDEDVGSKIEDDGVEERTDDVSSDDDGSIAITMPHSFHPFKLPAIPESQETQQFTDSTDSKTDRQINAGYILFDGSEIKYVSNKVGTTEPFVRGSSTLSSDKFSSIRSRASTTTQNSDQIPVNYYLSVDELLGQEYMKRNASFSVTPCSRLPTNSHLSLREKLYFFFIGLACVVSFNAMFMSVAYFKTEFFGDRVLMILGSCHFIPALVAMTIVFMGRQTWFPFAPTVITSFLLMAGVVAVFPIFAAVNISFPVYGVYALLSLNGLCSGFSFAASDKMVKLFPGGKSSWLFRWGVGTGSLVPAIAQLIPVLIDFRQKNMVILKENNILDLYIVFSVAFLGISLGFVSAIKLSRSGIYGLFADSENSPSNPKSDTISSSPIVRNERCRKIVVLLLAEILVTAVTWYCVSMAPIVHSKTSTKVPFWEMHLATVLIGIYQFGSFTGIILGTLSGCCCKPLPKMVQSGSHFVLAVLRLGFVAAIVFYIRGPFLVYNNIFIMGLYFFLAVTNESLLVGMATQSLSMCGLHRKDLCPIVSQVTWLCVHMGIVVGVALSYVPTHYISQ